MINPISQMSELRLSVAKCPALSQTIWVHAQLHHYRISLTLRKFLRTAPVSCKTLSPMNLPPGAAVRIKLDGDSVWHLVSISEMFRIFHPTV